MKRAELIELSLNLSDLPGAPGFENAVAEYCAGELKKLYPELEKLSQVELALKPEKALAAGSLAIDKMQNLSLSLPQNKGGRLRVLLDSHLDEVAFMVRGIEANALLRIQALGGWSSLNISAHTYLLPGKSGKMHRAVTASIPPHYLKKEERNKLPESDAFLLDLGTRDPEDLKRWGIGLGTPVIPEFKASFDPEQELIWGKAFDCRAGCAAQLNCLDLLRGKNLEVDVFSCFSAQEEVGIRGAEVLAKRFAPDLAIVFEGCPADDSFGAPEQWQTAVGKGPMLRYLDQGMITNPAFQNWALKEAEAAGIPVQTAVRQGGSTNARAYHLSAKGTACIVVGVPVRYAHTHYGQIALSDLENAAKLVALLLEKLSPEVYEAL
ncbi:MAG: M20/M25/M40 family metallo-hydrolase [Eubacteriales bacterium]|nr:M20/M25/M40 family metallo-hydrolase [Eubacteriales bacterium]